ncbi:hypothetical protein ACFS27_00355 [Promicromonospora vindobonensis]|uniref:Uncharacterized protein n=1 Tax=Promicromonospora vindobonensis TaxID=195748 RepID=A0ABW5VK54_9MICO
MTKAGKKQTCFIAMPITTHPEHAERYGGDPDHWAHVMDSLFEKAIEQAGFEPIKPVADGSHLIHGLIIQHLSTADLVLVDLSVHNPNVFFELGIRTALNLPIALVRDEFTVPPFDTSGINTHPYDSNLRGWELEQQQHSLAQHIQASYLSCGSQNPLWRRFGLTIKASEPDANESPLEAKVDLLMSQIGHMQSQMDRDRAVLRGSSVESDRPRSLGFHDSPQSEAYQALVDNVQNLLAVRHPDGSAVMDFEMVGPGVGQIVVDRRVTEREILQIQEVAAHLGVNVLVRRSGFDHREPSDHEAALAGQSSSAGSASDRARRKREHERRERELRARRQHERRERGLRERAERGEPSP